MEDTVTTENIQEEEVQEAKEELQEAQDELQDAQDELKEATEETPDTPKTYDESYIKKIQEKVQKKIDKVTAKMYNYKERAEIAEAKLKEVSPADKPRRPNPKDFIDEYDQVNYDKYNQAVEQYEDARDNWKETQKSHESYQKSIEEEIEAEKRENIQRYKEQIMELKNTVPNIVEIVSKEIFSPNLAEAIYASEESGKLALYLGQNESEAIRLSNAGEKEMVRELGKIEGKLNTLTRKSSNALPPISPVDDSRGIPDVDESKLSDDEWFARAEKRRLDNLKKKYG